MIIRSLSDLKPAFTGLYKQAQLLLEAGKIVEATSSEYKKKRSSEQNRYYWLLCGEIGQFLDDAGLEYGEYGLKYTSEIIHEINKKVFGISTTTKMKVGEFVDYTTKLTAFWQEKTSYEWQPSELPVGWLIKQGYNERDLVEKHN